MEWVHRAGLGLMLLLVIGGIVDLNDYESIFLNSILSLLAIFGFILFTWK